MFINEKIDLLRNSTSGVFSVRIEGNTTYVDNTSPIYNDLKAIYANARSTAMTVRYPLADDIVNLLATIGITAANSTVQRTDEEILLEGLTRLISFFTEFSFEPNFRFLNSFSLALAKNKTSAKNYLLQYFELIDSPYYNEIKAKINSAEFKDIIAAFEKSHPTQVINSRFKLYYGSQGTGKTTIAMKETDNRVMVCNSSMLPADIMEDFVFIDGKATFQPSALWRCMVEGKAITLDEINLLPFDTLRFLQTILDGKKEFLYKGNNIVIADGFQIIGTMNLVVNGMTYGLPEPLVDRCAETRKFSLTAKDLLSAIM